MNVTGESADPSAAAEAEAVKQAVASAGATWARLEDQLGWYDRKSSQNQTSYKRLKLAELAGAASLPLLVTLEIPSLWPGLVGAGVAVLAGVEHLFQFQSNWITYRSTAEALKHERYLYLAGAGPYDRPDRHKVLAEKLEGLISQEHAKWTESNRRERDSSPAPGV
ncbi:MAG TPA: DUF4231 domain-containing protein [Actinomycetota bacterium]|nr:DUF4231 domain-containing protein [Actinomycetota bacterium]